MTKSPATHIHIVSNLTALASLVVLSIPFVLWGAAGALTRFSNDVRQWLPQGFEEARQYRWFSDHFGADEMVVVSWPGCTLRDPRVEQAAEALRKRRMPSGEPEYARVVTGPGMLDQIMALGVKPEAALERCRGIFVGLDGHQTCLLAFPTSSAAGNRTQLVAGLQETLESEIGLSPEELHLGGPTIDGAAIDSESKRSLQQYLGWTVIVVMGLTWLRIRHGIAALTLLAFAAYNGLLSMSLVYWTGAFMNLTMIMLPTLTFILSVSAGVHMTNYFSKRVVGCVPELAVDLAIRDGARPVFLSALTTALGLLSLGSSQILPIRWFGLYSAVSLMVGIIPIILLLPHALGWVVRRWPLAVPNSDADRRWSNRRERRMTTMAILIKRWHWAISTVGLIVVVTLAWGISKLGASVKIQDRFASTTKIIGDYRWLEAELGPLVPMEVVLEFARDHPLPSWQRMLLTMAVERALQTSDLINASYSAATFRPILTGGSGSVARAADQLTRETWESQLPQLKAARLVADGDDTELWRISLRIAALNDIDYGELLDIIDRKVDEQLSLVNERLQENSQPTVRAIITGGVPMMYKAQHQVLNDLIVSFGTAFLLISVTMMIVVRSIGGGLLSMIPNVFPPLTVFGAMGWLGMKIEIGSVMTASVALGIAVDDTIHFLTWYQRSLDEGATPVSGIRQAYLQCAKSMWDSTLICSLGVAPFMLSVFMPTVRFARLMALLLFVALVGDLLVLPALLVGPGRRLFSSAKREKMPARVSP